MQFPANLVLLGASSAAAIAIFVCGRLLIATVHELGNPALDPKARRFIGYWALGVALAILIVGAAVTMMAHASTRQRPGNDLQMSPAVCSPRLHGVRLDYTNAVCSAIARFTQTRSDQCQARSVSQRALSVSPVADLTRQLSLKVHVSSL